MLVVFSRFASAVIYFNLLLWHLLFKFACSLRFVECHFSELWDCFEVTSRLLLSSFCLLSPWHWLSRSWSETDSDLASPWLGVFATFSCYRCFSEPEKSTKIHGLLALNNVSYTDHKLILAFNDWEVKRNWKRKYLLRRLKGLARVKAEKHRYLGPKLPYNCPTAQVMDLS